MAERGLRTINIHSLLEKCKSKKELYRFLQQDCKAFLPKINSVNVYFFRKILKGEKEVFLIELSPLIQYIKREDVKVSAVPHIEGLSVHDFLIYVREKPQLLKFLPDERDWVHLERQWICDILYTVDTENFQKVIDDAILFRHQKIEEQHNLTIQVKPEFAAALQQCLQFSHDKGRSVFLLKDSSRRKRTRQEIEEVKNEENVLKDDKQEFLRQHKRLKNEKEDLQHQIIELNQSQHIINELIHAGILNEEGELSIQQQFNI